MGTLISAVPEQPGPNCATGGMHLTAGVDRNRDGTLNEEEVDPSSNKFLCNGAQGPRGPEGQQGSQGPQGESGALAFYGDGSAGDLFFSADRQPVDFSGGYATLPKEANLMFRNVTIDGSVTFASGTMIRATGDIIINESGHIGVSPEFQIEPGNPARKGIAMSGASGSQGGRGLVAGRAGILSRADLEGGGSGYSATTDNNVSGGVGGPRLILAARGNIIIRGTIDVAGRPGINLNPTRNPGTAVAGAGGGGGGVVSLISRGLITVAGNGKISANGGPGANGWQGSNPVTGQVYGGGGGGGGGIIHFLSANVPSIENLDRLNVTSGAAGQPGVSGTPTTLAQAGGGGGASGGGGGNGTTSTSGSGAAQNGAPGQLRKTVTPQPELLFF
ncbi:MULTISPECIES: DUF7151 family protein [unclassified Corallococcus]|uniref:DUF7151 family protein n=1 Tax=unclassified Corallococcus TaxID=2685029 RepID=UPI001F5D8ED2|nr:MULTISPECIES: hypothetical protein [unclassified Corallococcus]WAS84595.1 hypothetical protein O0N60_35665 [Corallococcus sp. NCRR]